MAMPEHDVMCQIPTHAAQQTTRTESRWRPSFQRMATSPPRKRVLFCKARTLRYPLFERCRAAVATELVVDPHSEGLDIEVVEVVHEGGAATSRWTGGNRQDANRIVDIEPRKEILGLESPIVCKRMLVPATQ